MTNKTSFDVCIVGAGPAGLACLSAIREPYSLDTMTATQVQVANQSLHLRNQMKVCLIDPHPHWMESWKSNFEQLTIRHLRSPAMAHPNIFDKNALFAYALQHSRDQTDLIESGCSSIKDLYALGQTQLGLWKLPSITLFQDFCDEMIAKLEHTYMQGHVTDIDRCQTGQYELQWTDANGESCVTIVKNVILAMGTVGNPIVPEGLRQCPSAMSWTSPDAFAPPKKRQRVLVMGGGLTAVQAALRIAQQGHTCVLCSRRRLQEKHFDIPVDWFDQRKTNHYLSCFYHDTIEQRLRILKEARDGGSVPPIYLKRVDACQRRITCWVGDVEYRDTKNEKVTIQFEGASHQFDRVIVACGVAPDCLVHPLVEKIQAKWPIPIHGGLPDITENLSWHSDGTEHQIFIVGALSALQVGPDAANLMGIRRAALVVAQHLDCRCWLRQSALSNQFEAFIDSDTEEESINDCSTCEDGDSD